MTMTTPSASGFTVTVKDHLMIAHSLRGETFGPAQKLHGATYVVSATFQAPRLNADGIVIDIGKARELLQAVLDQYRYENLDTLPEFQGKNSTTEFLCAHFHSLLAGKLAGSFAGWLTIELEESPVAAAAYTSAVPAEMPPENEA